MGACGFPWFAADAPVKWLSTDDLWSVSIPASAVAPSAAGRGLCAGPRRPLRTSFMAGWTIVGCFLHSSGQRPTRPETIGFQRMSELFSTPVLTAFAVCGAAAAATVIGSVMVLNANRSSPRLLAFGLAFSGGAMVYVSLVEIFTKSHQSFAKVYGDKLGYQAATLAFFAGVALLALMDRLVPNPHHGIDLSKNPELEAARLKRVGLMAAAAITAHNLPEGLATFFATLDNPVVGAPLALAIAIHNIPEGVSIAIPVYYATGSRTKAVAATAISAMAEPLGALIGYLALAPFLTPAVFGAVFGMIAGVMVFLALDELMPEAKRYSKGHEAAYGMIIGMGAMAASLVLFR
jgi:zinc transporter, ZIP family